MESPRKPKNKRVCMCVVMLSMMWPAKLQLDLACLEQHRTEYYEKL